MTPTTTAPAPHDVDAAPQLLVVSLAGAALRAVSLALDSAHPVLVGTLRRDRPPPVLLTTERLAVLVLDAAGTLGQLLHDYAGAVQLELSEELEGDPF